MRLQGQRGLRPVAAAGHRDRSPGMDSAPVARIIEWPVSLPCNCTAKKIGVPAGLITSNFFETGGERLLATELEVSSNTFRWASR